MINRITRRTFVRTIVGHAAAVAGIGPSLCVTGDSADLGPLARHARWTGTAWGFHCGASSEPDETNFKRAPVLVDVLRQFPGTQLARFSLQWQGLQPQSTARINWRTLDRLVSRAVENGWGVVLVVSDAPQWARAVDGVYPAELGPSGPYATFWAELVERYGRRVVALEPWNEPNNMFWFGERAHRVLQGQSDDRARSILSGAAARYAELFSLAAGLAGPEGQRKLLLGSIEWNCSVAQHSIYVSELARQIEPELALRILGFGVHPTTARLQNLRCNLEGIRARLDGIPSFAHLDLACTEFYSISRLRSQPAYPVTMRFERRAVESTIRTYETMNSLAASCRISHACYFQAFGWSSTLQGNDQGLLYNIEDYAAGRGPLRWTAAGTALRQHLLARPAS